MRVFLLVLMVAGGCGGRVDGGMTTANRQTIADTPTPAPAPKRGTPRVATDSVDFAGEALARAQQWVDEGVMYSFSPNYAGYRTDCSGLVSWAWQLGAPGHTTYSLGGGPSDDGASYVIAWDELAPGDALNYPGNVSAGTGHVMLFAGWADAAHYGFYTYEEYDFGHPASYLYHTLDSVWPVRVGSYYVPIRSASRDDGGGSGGDGGGDCASLGYTGRCDGPIAQWWQDGQCMFRDCPAEGASCGWVSPSVGYDCIAPTGGDTTFACDDVGYAGDCRSNWLVWMENGECNVQDCSALGATCGWRDDDVGNDCL